MCQFRVKSEVQTLRTESGVDFKSGSGSLGLYLQHIFKNQPWLLRESGETARNLYALILSLVQRLHKLYAGIHVAARDAILNMCLVGAP